MKCCSLMWFKILHSNVCQPMTKWYNLMWYPPYTLRSIPAIQALKSALFSCEHMIAFLYFFFWIEILSMSPDDERKYSKRSGSSQGKHAINVWLAACISISCLIQNNFKVIELSNIEITVNWFILILILKIFPVLIVSQMFKKPLTHFQILLVN